MIRNLCRCVFVNISEQIIVDQFGWQPDAVKVTLFADPQIGQNSTVSDKLGDFFEVGCYGCNSMMVLSLIELRVMCPVRFFPIVTKRILFHYISYTSLQ